jgi:beta-N-acetylhexosaminidase
MKAAITGIAGTRLTAPEAALLRAHPPAGIILFARNIADPAQLARLVAALRAVLPAEAVLMLDQEGGRVARLRPPHWRAHPPAAAIGRLFAADPASGLRAAWLTGALIGTDCAAAGLDVVCAPVLDLRRPGAHDVIGDRAYGGDADTVARLGGAMAAGLLAGGVQPVGKHAPGHGRAGVDSHEQLPVVESGDLDDDLIPFASNADLPWMMTAHVLFRAWDAAAPASLSARVIGEVIRGRIGFQGLLVSDDLAMRALTGPPEARARAALAAGCDIALYCPGEAEANQAVLAAVPALSSPAASRLAAATALAQGRRLALDPSALRAERDGLDV